MNTSLPFSHNFSNTSEETIYSTSSSTSSNSYSNSYSFPSSSSPLVIYTASPPSAHDDRRASFLKSKDWVKKVAEWIAQTERTGKQNHLGARAGASATTSSEQVLYVASPPASTTSFTHPLYPFAYPTGSGTSNIHTSSRSSSSSAKSLRRLSHGRTSSLESITEEVEE